MLEKFLVLVSLVLISVTGSANVECTSYHVTRNRSTDGSNENLTVIVDYDEKNFLVGDYMLITAGGDISRIAQDEMWKIGWEKFESQHQNMSDTVLRMMGNGTDVGIEVRTPGNGLRSVVTTRQTGAITFEIAKSGLQMTCTPH